ncbi:MAG: multiheme c-type cytochrome [Pirellulales bacterium]
MRSDRKELRGVLQYSVGLILLVLISGCSSKSEVSVFVSGDTAGWITPCGCAANQSGGLARRSLLITQSSGGVPPIVLDAGGSATGTNEYHRIKLTALLRGMRAMGLNGHNIGESESAFAPSDLTAFAKDTDVTWLSANLSDSAGKEICPNVLLLERGGLSIAVTGVLEPSRVKHPEWQAAEPVPAILKALKNVKADVRIVLAYYDEPGLRALAEALPEVDYIIGGPTGQALSRFKSGRVSVMAATNKGKFIAGLKLARSPSGFEEKSAAVLEVSSTIAEDDLQLDNLKKYYATLAARDFTAEEAGYAVAVDSGRQGYRIAGSESCARCHSRDDTLWHASKHSHAWEVLIAKQAQGDPYCRQCHTTGYGYDGGFVNLDRSKSLVHVGCENCHGPSAAHVADPRKKTPFPAKEQCIRCHDHENSPGFVWEPYWARVFHGDQKATTYE